MGINSSGSQFDSWKCFKSKTLKSIEIFDNTMCDSSLSFSEWLLYLAFYLISISELIRHLDFLITFIGIADIMLIFRIYVSVFKIDFQIRMATDVLSSEASAFSEVQDNKSLETNIKYSIYKVKLIESQVFLEEAFENLLLISEKAVYMFILCCIYLFVALEEVDHQFLSAAGNHIESEEKFDEWSIWYLLQSINLSS